MTLIDCDVHAVVGSVATLAAVPRRALARGARDLAVLGPDRPAAPAEPRDLAARRPRPARRRRAGDDARARCARSCSTRSASRPRSSAATTPSTASATPTPPPRSARRSTTGIAAEWLEPEPRLRARDRRAERTSRRWRRARSSASPGIPAFVAVRAAGALGGAVRQPPLVAAVRGRDRPRPRRRAALRRLPGAAADGRRLADDLARGLRRHGDGVPVAADEPRRRGRVRPLPSRCASR